MPFFFRGKSEQEKNKKKRNETGIFIAIYKSKLLDVEGVVVSAFGVGIDVVSLKTDGDESDARMDASSGKW